MKQYGNVYIINISLPPKLLEEIDEWVKKTDQTRSRFFREAIRRYIVFLKKEKA